MAYKDHFLLKFPKILFPKISQEEMLHKKGPYFSLPNI